MATFDFYVTLKLTREFSNLEAAAAWLRRASPAELLDLGAVIVELQVSDPTGATGSWRRLREVPDC